MYGCFSNKSSDDDAGDGECPHAAADADDDNDDSDDISLQRGRQS